MFNDDVITARILLNEPIFMRYPLLQFVAPLTVVPFMLMGCATSQRTTGGSPSIPPAATSAADTLRQDNPRIHPVSYENDGSHQGTQLAGMERELAASVELAPVDLDVPAEYGFDLDTLVGMALSSNPAVAQAEAAVAQASGVHCQVGLRPNPTIGYFGQEIGNDGSAGQHGIFASQTIIRGDKLHWNRCVTSHEVKQMRSEADAQRGRVETDVRIRFYRALAAQKKLKRAKEFRVDAVKAVEVAQKRLEAQEGSKPDLLQSQLLVDQIDLSIRQSELDWQAAWSELAAIVGQPSLQATELIGDFVAVGDTDSELLYQQVVAASPQLSAARERIERARTNLQRQRNQAVPNLNLQFGVGVDDSTDDSFANVQVGMPIPIHNRNQGNIAAAQAEYYSACQNLRRLKLLLRRDLAEAHRRYQTSAVAIAKYEHTMIPRAEETLQLVEKARRAGEIDFLRVLTARQTLFELQQQWIAVRGKLSEADAEINGYLLTDALGTEITFNGGDGLRGQALSGQ